MPSIISSTSRGELKTANNSKVMPRYDSVTQQEYRNGDVE